MTKFIASRGEYSYVQGHIHPNAQRSNAVFAGEYLENDPEISQRTSGFSRKFTKEITVNVENLPEANLLEYLRLSSPKVFKNSLY